MYHINDYIMFRLLRRAVGQGIKLLYDLYKLRSYTFHKIKQIYQFSGTAYVLVT